MALRATYLKYRTIVLMFYVGKLNFPMDGGIHLIIVLILSTTFSHDFLMNSKLYVVCCCDFYDKRHNILRIAFQIPKLFNNLKSTCHSYVLIWLMCNFSNLCYDDITFIFSIYNLYCKLYTLLPSLSCQNFMSIPGNNSK